MIGGTIAMKTKYSTPELMINELFTEDVMAASYESEPSIPSNSIVENFIGRVREFRGD